MFRNVPSPSESKIRGSVVDHSERQLLFHNDYKMMIANIIISDENIDMLPYLPFARSRSDPAGRDAGSIANSNPLLGLRACL
jgi:hypothetical protein